MENFPITLLKDLCNNFKEDIVDGPFGANLKREHYQSQGIPVLKIQNIKPFSITLKKMDFVREDKYEELKRHAYQDGDIIMTKLGNPLGESAVVEGISDGLVVADLVRIRAQKVDTKYLCYHLNSPVTNAYINSQQKGTTRPRVRISVVRELPIYTPPIPEQKRIVAILDKAFADIDRVRELTERNLQNARELFESYLQEVFYRSCEGWVESNIGDVCLLHQGLAINRKTKHLLVNKSNLPLLRIKDLRGGSAEQYVAEVGYPENARVFEKDIIYTRTGQIGLVFRGREGVLHNNSFKVTPNDQIDSCYLFWWLQNARFKEKVTKLASKAAQPDITHKIFKHQKIDIPPMEYQVSSVMRIEELFSQTNALAKACETKLEMLAELKKALLKKAFLGHLTNDDRGITA